MIAPTTAGHPTSTTAVPQATIAGGTRRNDPA
ncbi:hypothetical protein BJ992_004519 [Sphaerisporangium rubeum]|uniref:Uncharacterized protein n=1 Tax=Sphaerisporangium rubeum TaxID=321317 RepID=A0A7X0IHK2_9ACTN|nr:hypothetical protein [Sphaerisporangium rubeum]